MPIGLIESADFEETIVRLDPGGHLLILSDGLIEAQTPDGAMIGDDRITQMFSAAEGTPAKMLDAIVDGVDHLAGGTGCDDDVSAILLRMPEN